MKQWIQDLLALQELDLRVRQLKIRQEVIPTEIKQLEDELAAAKEKLEGDKTASQKTELDIKQVESDIAGINEQIAKLQSQSIMVKKNDEYKALLSEIEGCNKKISDLETKEIMLLDDLEERKEAFRTLEKRFSEREKSILAEVDELKQLSKEVEEEIARVKEARKEKEAPIPPEILSPYNRLIPRSGIPFVKINEENCGNCHLKLTPQTINQSRKGVLTLCDHCSHLIYSENTV